MEPGLTGVNPEALIQLARILGRAEVYRTLGLEEGRLPADFSVEQLGALRGLIDGQIDHLARSLLEEAAACDDVINGESAMAYLEDRLAFLGELLTEAQKQKTRKGFREFASRWG